VDVYLNYFFERINKFRKLFVNLSTKIDAAHDNFSKMECGPTVEKVAHVCPKPLT